MSEATQSAEPVVPIRHQLAVRPVPVSLSAKPKFPRRSSKNKGSVAPHDGCSKKANKSKKNKRNKREVQTEQVAVEPSKRDSHFLVQIPYGPLVKVPVGVSYCRMQCGNYKYSLLIDPATGYLRHVHKKTS